MQTALRHVALAQVRTPIPPPPARAPPPATPTLLAVCTAARARYHNACANGLRERAAASRAAGLAPGVQNVFSNGLGNAFANGGVPDCTPACAPRAAWAIRARVRPCGGMSICIRVCCHMRYRMRRCVGGGQVPAGALGAATAVFPLRVEGALLWGAPAAADVYVREHWICIRGLWGIFAIAFANGARCCCGARRPRTYARLHLIYIRGLWGVLVIAFATGARGRDMHSRVVGRIGDCIRECGRRYVSRAGRTTRRVEYSEERVRARSGGAGSGAG